MNIAEQIAALEETRKEKAARMEEIAQKSMDENRTMDDAEAEEYDTVDAEVKRLDADLKRLRNLERMQAATAEPAQKHADEQAKSNVKDGNHSRLVARQPKLDPGIGFARYARVKLLAQIDRQPIESVAKHLYPGDERLLNVVKAPVEAANTMDAEWAGNLVLDSGTFADFVEFLRPRTIIGQVADRLRTLPFDTPVLIQNTGGTAAWVKEGEAKPVTKWSYTRTKLAPLTVAAISVATKQQLMRASLAADQLLRDELARSVTATLNETFADPSVAPVSDESPGSIFNGVAALDASTRPGVFGVRCDIETLMNHHSDANLEFDGLFWIMSGRNAIALSQMPNEIGGLAFPTVNPTGGTLGGFPVVVSNYAPTDSSGSLVALVKGSEIFLGDEGGIDVSMSDQASIVMDNEPAGSSVTPTAAQVVSMYQTNSVAFRVERHINWQRRRPAAVAYMSVGWTACTEDES